jgi:hypothetical protein
MAPTLCAASRYPAKAAGSFDYQARLIFCSTHCLAVQGGPGEVCGQGNRRTGCAEQREVHLPDASGVAAGRALPENAAWRSCRSCRRCGSGVHLPDASDAGDRPGSCPKCAWRSSVAGAEEENTELRDMTQRFWVSAILSVPLVFLAMGPYLGFAEPFGLRPTRACISSSRSERRSCCGAAGRSSTSSGSRSQTAARTCTP